MHSAVLRTGGEPGSQPLLHTPDLIVLFVADCLGQRLDLDVVRHTAHQQLLRHHDRAHVVPKHVAQEGLIKSVP